MSVYYRNKLRYIAVIPLGGNNITKDLESLQLEETEAEALKTKYGSAYTDPATIDPNEVINIDSTRSIKRMQLVDVIEARTLEIIENVRYLIPAEYADKLICGIVLTGGGSNMKNIETAFRNATNMEKVRVAKTTAININSKDSVRGIAEDGTMNTILSLVAKGTMNCAGREFSNTLFGDDLNTTTTTTTTQTTTATSTVANLDAAAMAAQRAEAARKAEEERKRLEEEERKRQEEEERLKKEESKKKPSFFKRMKDSLTNFGKSLVEPEHDNN